MSILKSGRPSYKEKALSQLNNLNEDTCRLNVVVKKTFHKQLRQRALDENTTLTDLVNKVLSEYVKK